MTDDDIRRKATRSIGWVVAERWGSRLLSLLVLVILTRLLEPSEFGLVSLATSVVAVLQVFVDSGFSKSLIQRKQLEPKDASTAFWTSLVMSLVLSGLLIILAPYFATLFSQPDLALVLQVLSIGLPIVALSRTPAALLERDFDFKALSVRQLLGTLIGAAAAIPAAFAGWGVWALVTQTLVTAVVSVATLWASTDWRPRFEYSWVSFRELWGVGSSVLGIELLDAVQANVDKIVVGIFFSTTELGYYFLAQRMGTILIELVTTIISRISFTTFARVQDDIPRVNRIFRQLTFAAAAVSFPVFGLVAVLAPQLVEGLFGSAWTPAVPLMWILAPGWAIGALMYFDRAVLLATRNTGTALGLALFQNVVSIGLIFAFLPLGVAGIAISRLARIITWPIRLRILHRIIALRVWKYLTELARCALAIAPILLAIALLQMTPWAHVKPGLWVFAIPAGLIGFVLYALLLWIFAGVENRKVLRAVSSDLRVAIRTRK